MIIRFADYKGDTYEDTYGGWLSIFKLVAEKPNNSIAVEGYPKNWFVLLRYLGAHVGDTMETGLNREFVEWMCAKEPVLVDALWRADMKWIGHRRHIWEDKFNISTYSGFWRPEIKAYLEKLHNFIPQKRKCILVPCAADKPYPASLHRVIRGGIPDDYEIIVVTSALGLVPESLWPEMPIYDAGLPYFDRVREEVHRYFGTHRDYEHIVNYTDMLQEDINEGIPHTLFANGIVQTPVRFPRRCDYQPLMRVENLQKLGKVLR